MKRKKKHWIEVNDNKDRQVSFRLIFKKTDQRCVKKFTGGLDDRLVANFERKFVRARFGLLCQIEERNARNGADELYSIIDVLKKKRIVWKVVMIKKKTIKPFILK